MNNARRKFLILFVLLLLIVASAPALADFSAIVVSGTMTVYSDKALTKEAGTLNKGTVVTVDKYADGVARIELNGRRGYARVKDMSAVKDVAREMVANTDTRVYAKPDESSDFVNMKAGTVVYLLEADGECAKVEKNGRVGYTYASHLSPANAQKEDSKSDDAGVVYEEFKAIVDDSSIKVYEKASSSSKMLGRVKRDTVVNVHAYNDTWAYIELNGRYGFCRHSGLIKYDDSPHAYLTNDRYSSEKKIYLFLIGEIGFNEAQACGVIANIRHESNFRPNAVGDAGRSYGICQWFSARKTRLINFCEKKGYDYTTLEGQLWFLKYELTNFYPKTLREMKEFENTAEGAYLAGHYWCYNFEGPANRERLSVTRGNLSKNTYWPKYSK